MYVYLYVHYCIYNVQVCIGPFSLAVKNRDVRKTAILRWKLLGNYAKSHPKDRQKNPAPECDFSNIAWNFPTITQWGHSSQKNNDFCHVTSRNFRFITRALTILHTRVRVFFTIEYLPRAVLYSTILHAAYLHLAITRDREYTRILILLLSFYFACRCGYLEMEKNNSHWGEKETKFLLCMWRQDESCGKPRRVEQERWRGGEKYTGRWVRAWPRPAIQGHPPK